MLPIASPPTLPINTSTSSKANTPKPAKHQPSNALQNAYDDSWKRAIPQFPRGRTCGTKLVRGAGSGHLGKTPRAWRAEGQETPPLPLRGIRPRTAGRGSGGLGLSGDVVRWPSRRAGRVSKFSDILVDKSAHEGRKDFLASWHDQKLGTRATATKGARWQIPSFVG